MNDRELIELAAKAAGYVIEEHASDGAWVYPADSAPDRDGEYPIFLWRPRIDDGDALRLAVKLSMLVCIRKEGKTDVTVRATTGVIPWLSFQQQHEGDPCAATRRTIVRAAAEIGKGM